MKKASKLFEILTENHTKILPAKYAKIVLQVATLEERSSAMMSFGMTGKAKAVSGTLVTLLEAVKKEFEEDNKK